jgi:dihydrofolate synthase/folylpolyglutamate synthase
MLEEGMESPTEFELITAIAFLYFSKQDMDFLILEVGLGGMGDSTNMVSRPVASVITSISFDHMEYLGHTLEKIAIEKAGIIKPGVPVIINVEDQNASAAIREIADTRGSEIYSVDANDLQVLEKTVDGYTFNVEIEGIFYTGLSISMIGNHQIGNAICALTVLEVLTKNDHVRLDPAKLYSGFRKAKQTGRFELLQKEPFVIIDGAHNEAGAEALRMVIADLFPDSRILMIVGMLADKKIDKLLDQFEMITDEFIATEPDNPRKLPATELCRQITKRGKKCTAIENPEDACQYAYKLASSFDVIVYAGSLYLVGKIRGLLNHEEK